MARRVGSARAANGCSLIGRHRNEPVGLINLLVQYTDPRARQATNPRLTIRTMGTTAESLPGERRNHGAKRSETGLTSLRRPGNDG